MNDILVALITGGLALIGSAIGVFSGIKTSQKVTEVKIEEMCIRDRWETLLKILFLEKNTVLTQTGKAS